MSKDLFLGKTKRNWSREPAASNPEYATQTAATRESNQIAKLKALKAASDKGDKKAQKKWAKLNKKVVKLHLKASKGDLKAAKTLATLTPTGLFVTTIGPKAMKTAMRGTFVGKDEILGTFVGNDALTEIVGNDKLTEIITSGAFVGNDKLTEIITSGCAKLPKSKGGKRKSSSSGIGSVINFPEIIRNGEFIGEEERALAAEGGACERAALKRRTRR